MMIKFNDGVQFNTSGELRAVKRRDGWYVVGEGMLVPVADRAEAEEEIRAVRERKAAK